MRLMRSLFGAAAGLMMSRPVAGQDPVRLESGQVRGSREGDLVIYRGIPYAAPPTDSLRWKPPRAPAPWTGVREATSFGLPCPQPKWGPLTFVKEWSEDCLTANVWTPVAAASLQPVLVVIPGGGFFGGAGNDPLTEPAELARRGIIVVTFNYRLGVFGFFAHPSLSQESPTRTSGNYGLMDQIALLRWVQANIAAFGGDPRNVTIAGSSAGGSSVLYLMVAPAAKGLFARAISQSAALVYSPLAHVREPRYGLEARESEGLRLGTDLAALRALPAKDLLERSNTRTDLMFTDGPSYWAMVDGSVIPDEPWRLFESGQFEHVPLIVGANKDEGTLFAYRLPIQTGDAWRAHLAQRHPGVESIVQADYSVKADSEVHDAGVRWVNDWYFQSTARSVARAVSANGSPVYLYNFSRVPPVHPLSKETVGAFHSAEAVYEFDRTSLATPNRYEAADHALAKAMSGAWAQFARTGDPNAAGLPAWPKYERSSDRHMDFGAEIRVGSGFNARALDRVDSAFAIMRAAYQAKPKPFELDTANMK